MSHNVILRSSFPTHHKAFKKEKKNLTHNDFDFYVEGVWGPAICSEIGIIAQRTLAILPFAGAAPHPIFIDGHAVNGTTYIRQPRAPQPLTFTTSVTGGTEPQHAY